VFLTDQFGQQIFAARSPPIRQPEAGGASSGVDRGKTPG
jgi:hypothetical protein